MAKRCTPCLDAEAKRLLADAFPQAAKRLEGIADCEDGKVFEFCGKGKSARAPSEYTQFVKKCLTSKDLTSGKAPAAMQACAAEWRARKAR